MGLHIPSPFPQHAVGAADCRAVNSVVAPKAVRGEGCADLPNRGRPIRGRRESTYVLVTISFFLHLFILVNVRSGIP